LSRWFCTALARHKEEYIFDLIIRLGTVVYDNDPNAQAYRRDPAYQGCDHRP
jgi:hypothetical protein